MTNDSNNDNNNNNPESKKRQNSLGEPGLDRYRRTQILTANRETILLMLYDGAIRFLKNAITSLDANDFSSFSSSIVKAQDIINELQSSLNFNADEKTATDLERLYQFITRNLLSANAEKSKKYIEENLKILETLYSAWEEAIAKLRAERKGAELSRS